MFEIGDLVQFKTITRGPVKGVIVDLYPDPVHHMCVVMRVTSRDHGLYPHSMEFAFAFDDPDLTKRKFYTRKR